MDNKSIFVISDVVYRVSIQVKLDNHIEYSSIAFYKTEEGRLYIVSMLMKPYMNSYIRLLFISGLDYDLYKYGCVWIFFNNIGDFDRYLRNVYCTVCNIVCLEYMYDRKKVEEFFSNAGMNK